MQFIKHENGVFTCNGDCEYCDFLDECIEEIPTVYCPDCGEEMEVYRVFDEDEVEDYYFEEIEIEIEDEEEIEMEIECECPACRTDRLLESAKLYVDEVFDKVVVVSAELENGYVITETGDITNGDEMGGIEEAIGKIEDKLLELEDYKFYCDMHEYDLHVDEFEHEYYDEDDCVSECVYCEYRDCCFR